MSVTRLAISAVLAHRLDRNKMALDGMASMPMTWFGKQRGK
jgi:hypothetical protein